MTIIDFIPGPPGEFGKRLEEYLYLAMAAQIKLGKRVPK